jgi:hypothetical protein
MSRPNVIAIELKFDRHDDGRYHIHSPDLPGLHLAGMNLDALRADFDSVLRDLLKGNANATAERIHHIPNLANQFGADPALGMRETCVVTLVEGR